MKKYTFGCLGLQFALMIVVGVSSLPGTTWAASSNPTCEMSAIIDGVTIGTRGSSPVFVQSGTSLQIVWESNRATKAVDQSKQTVALDGMATVTPARDTTYKYTFSRGSSRTTCSVPVTIVSGSVTAQSRGVVSSRPTIAGQARGVSAVTVSLTPAGTTTPVYVSETVRVRSSKWSTRVTPALPDGLYQILVKGIGSRNTVVVATSTLQIGALPAVSAFAPTVVVVPVPLLIGGVAHPGASVAVAYLQVINISTATATINGFTLMQAGTAPVTTVVGLTAVTDNGIARGTVGNMVTGSPFVGSSVFVPLVTTLAPREMRLVTIKAVMGPLTSSYLGTTLTLWVAGVSGDLRPHATFPLFGTVWTMGR